MEEKKERRGGARPNTGGYRPGAGRKPNPPEPFIEVLQDGEDDALKLLQDIAFGRVEVNQIQLRAAIAAVQYTHTKTHDGGKKELQQKNAKKVAGKFTTNKPPKLVANGGSLVDDGEE